MTDREPRVWFENEDIPCGVHVLDAYGEIHLVGEDDPLGEPHRMIGFGALVEIQLPNHGEAVADERARRDGAA